MHFYRLRQNIIKPFFCSFKIKKELFFFQQTLKFGMFCFGFFLFTQRQCACDCEELQIKQETSEEVETEAKSSKENKSSFKRAGKQSFGSLPNQPASSQSACQASLLSGWGWQQELAKQSDGERARNREGVFIIQKHSSSFSIFPSHPLLFYPTAERYGW